MAFVGIIALVATIVFLVITINPKWIKKDWTRKRTLLYALICFIIFIIMLIVGNPSSGEPESTDDSKKVVQQKSEPKNEEPKNEEPKNEEPKKEEPNKKLMFDPKGPDRDCGDFKGDQAAAQAFFEAAGPGDPHKLDKDKDGIACKTGE